jgi:uncharacterized protein (DUF488 family)
MPIYTIGYGNRPITDFLALLRHYAVDVLVDTRSVPYSRFRPAYRKQAFQAHLHAAGFEYRYLGDVLGGKHVDPSCMVNGEIDLACLVALPAFRAGLAQIEAILRAGRTPAVMCAELRPETCHRYWMLTPPLVERGNEVLHIDEHGGLKQFLV